MIYQVNAKGLQPSYYNDYMQALNNYCYLYKIGIPCSLRNLSGNEFLKALYRHHSISWEL